jgi:two-component system chemotaxis response regulator CheY
MQALSDEVLHRFRASKVLIVDDEHYTRKVIRALLMAIGITHIHDAPDGESGLEAITTIHPDIVLVDWEMPGLDGAGFVKRVRDPLTFPLPNVPIVMLTGHGERWRVIEAVKLGVHEYLLKPVSTRALLDRMISIIAHPRPMVRMGDFYGPQPRKMSTYKPDMASFPEELSPPLAPFVPPGTVVLVD